MTADPRDLIREARKFERLDKPRRILRDLADALEAAAARADQLERALRAVRSVFPQGVCSECAGFEHEVAQTNRVIDDALAADHAADEGASSGPDGATSLSSRGEMPPSGDTGGASGPDAAPSVSADVRGDRRLLASIRAMQRLQDGPVSSSASNPFSVPQGAGAGADDNTGPGECAKEKAE